LIAEGKFIDGTYSLTEDQVEELHRRGFITLRSFLSPEEMNTSFPAIRDYIENSHQDISSAERAMGLTPRKIVCSLEDAPQSVADFIMSPRLGELAARLLDVEAVRILQFTGFFKPGGGTPTPWHQDLSYIPLNTAKSLTIWIPLTDLTPEMADLQFAEGSHLFGQLDSRVAETQFSLVRNGAMQMGDVSVHMGWVLHCSTTNTSTTLRQAIAISYYADGARIEVRGKSPFIQKFLDKYFAGLAPGDLAEGPLTPVAFRRNA
jgi:hypothetical protein